VWSVMPESSRSSIHCFVVPANHVLQTDEHLGRFAPTVARR
jgi:hypothetical protein